MTDTFKEIEKLETDLWEAADNLRANSKLTSSDYFMPVLGGDLPPARGEPL
jgi:type I restriction enzyme M protein